MAPALVEDIPIRESVAQKANIKEGFNKELFQGGNKDFDNTIELKGSGKQPPATYPNYLPVWDNEKGVK